jgi:ribosomal-protein-alanine N-acetyltransferase
VSGEFRIEPMVAEHLDGVLALEESLFSEGPWTREMFRQELEDLAMSRPVVALLDGEVVGYMATWFLRDEVHLLNIGVAKAHQRKGYGRRMVEHLIRNARLGGRALVTLEVRAANDSALAMYDSLAFEKVAVRRGYYEETGEDALVMVLDLRAPEVPGQGASE